MEVQIKPWGNSQGIRFSREFLASVDIKPNDVLTVEIQDGKIVLSKRFQRKSLQRRAAEYGGELHLSEEISWEDPRGNEVW